MDIKPNDLLHNWTLEYFFSRRLSQKSTTHFLRLDTFSTINGFYRFGWHKALQEGSIRVEGKFQSHHEIGNRYRGGGDGHVISAIKTIPDHGNAAIVTFGCQRYYYAVFKFLTNGKKQFFVVAKLMTPVQTCEERVSLVSFKSIRSSQKTASGAYVSARVSCDVNVLMHRSVQTTPKKATDGPWNHPNL